MKKCNYLEISNIYHTLTMEEIKKKIKKITHLNPSITIGTQMQVIRNYPARFFVKNLPRTQVLKGRRPQVSEGILLLLQYITLIITGALSSSSRCHQPNIR